MTIEKQKKVDKDIENFGYNFLIEFFKEQIKDLQTYPPTTKHNNSIEQHKEILFYIKRKLDENTKEKLRLQEQQYPSFFMEWF